MTHKTAIVPLWRQLKETARVIEAVQTGASGTAAIEAVSNDLRPAVQALAFHVWRNLGRAMALRKQLAKRAPAPAADALLCTALALCWNEDDTPYDAFTLVNQAVESAKHDPRIRAQASFINACLRRFLREQAELVRSTDADPVARWNHPLWWIKRLQSDYPGAWKDILQAANRHAPMTLRVNRRQATADSYLAELHAVDISARRVGTSGIELTRAMPVGALPGFASGRVSVQDSAAQMAAPLLLEGLTGQGKLRILDACAAPGGKTGHLLEIAEADVLALEIDAGRASRISQNLARLGLQAEVKTADASRPAGWWDGRLFDGILLDAPCTASGIVRRHPDVRWLRRETDIRQLSLIQHQMLQALWPLLRPGGRLLYCTCSLFPAEGSDQVQTFLAHNSDATLLPSPGHLMPRADTISASLPDNQASDNDGFFYALLEKRMA